MGQRGQHCELGDWLYSHVKGTVIKPHHDQILSAWRLAAWRLYGHLDVVHLYLAGVYDVTCTDGPLAEETWPMGAGAPRLGLAALADWG